MNGENAAFEPKGDGVARIARIALVTASGDAYAALRRLIAAFRRTIVPDAQPSPVPTGLAGACPRCGQGKLFAGWLRVAPRCSSCGLDFSFADSADGPAVFLMFIVGFAVVGGALFVEFAYEPRWWVHALAWPALAALLCALLLRPLKGVMIALQYAHRAEEGRPEK